MCCLDERRWRFSRQCKQQSWRYLLGMFVCLRQLCRSVLFEAFRRWTDDCYSRAISLCVEWVPGLSFWVQVCQRYHCCAPFSLFVVGRYHGLLWSFVRSSKSNRSFELVSFQWILWNDSAIRQSVRGPIFHIHIYSFIYFIYSYTP